MLIMVDFENVKNGGLIGAEFLDENDKVVIFYSTHVPTMQRFYWEKLKNSGCELEAVKLVKDGKNGLDFYIASKIAEEVGCGYEGKIAIISLDRGFEAIKDYWLYRGKICINISICKNIRYGLMSEKNGSNRCKMLEEGKETIKFEKEIILYNERHRIEKEVSDVFNDTKYSHLVPQITNIILNDMTPKSRYIDALKTFGRSDGLRIYHIIKTEGV